MAALFRFRLVTLLVLEVLLFSALPPGHAGAALPPDGTASLPGAVAPSVLSGQARVLGAHDANAPIDLNLGLPLRDEAGLDAFLRDHAAYRQTMSHDEFDARFAPTSDQVQAVKDWAEEHTLHLTYASQDGLAIVVRGTTQQVEAALGVRIQDYQDSSGTTFFSADRPPTVPAALGLQTISGLNDALRFRPMGKRFATALSGYTPDLFRAAYDLAGHGYDGTGQTIGLILWGKPVPDSDLAAFAQNTGDTQMSAGTGPDQIQWIGTNGNDLTTSDNGTQSEIAMDVESSHGMATHSRLKFWLGNCTLTNGNCSPSNIGIEEAIKDAVDDPTVNIVSNSWGAPEEHAGQVQPGDFISVTSNYFKEGAALGKTFYFASGDSGWLSGGDGGVTGAHAALSPSDSPFVVAVGGTHLEMDGNLANYYDESVWSLDTSSGSPSGGGGGCSLLFSRPWWQVGVEAAASLGPGAPPCTGRAVPDIAADGDPSSGAFVYVNGGSATIGGTSLATPLTAGMAAVTDRYLAVHDLPLMGWAPPSIYALGLSRQYRSYFHDVQCGSNGFDAAPGWDESTGWGSQDWWAYTLGWAGQPPVSVLPPSWGCGTVLDPNNTGVGNGQLFDVSCPSPSVCYASGDQGELVKSTDAGATWNALHTNVSYALRSLSCPDIQTCYVAGDDLHVLHVTGGGTTVTSESTTLPDGYLGGIACPSVSVCYADGSSSYNGGGGVLVKRSTNGVWSIQASNISSQGITVDFYKMTCASLTTCYAGGSWGAIVSTTNGSTWNMFTNLPTSVSDTIFQGNTCLSPTDCYFTGSNNTVLHTPDGGGSWTVETVPDTNGSLVDVSCVTAASCYAIGGGNVVMFRHLTATGPVWDYQSTPWFDATVPLDNNGIDCADSSSCIVVGFYGEVMRKNVQGPFSVPVSAGWNLLSVPRAITGVWTTDGMATSLTTSLGATAFKALATYGAGRFQIYIPGYSKDATLNPAQGIFALSAAAGQWSLSGADYPSGLPISLHSGWNLVAAPYPPEGTTTTRIAAQVTGCTIKTVALLTHGSYTTWVPGQPSIPVSSASGMWIQCTSDGRWTPS